MPMKDFRYGLGNALGERQSDELYEREAIPWPAKPFFQAAVANFTRHTESEVDTANASRGPSF
jgi:non-heme chloroperoxidase